MGLVVYKLGGSLLTCADLAARLRLVLQERAGDQCLIVVGGGASADVVRSWSSTHFLSEESAHWLAIRSLSLTRALVLQLMPEFCEVSSKKAAQSHWTQKGCALLLDVETWLRETELCAHDCLPHLWTVTSDSIAAWVAIKWAADELILLKSTMNPTQPDAELAAKCEYVDLHFPHLVDRLPQVSWCNLRDVSPHIVSWFERRASRSE